MPNPGGGIAFNSSVSLQSAINANPSGSTFVCSSNAPVWNSTPDTGTKAPTIIFPGSPGQCVIDGGFADRIGIQAKAGTTISGGTWQNFGTTTHGTGIVTQDACTISDVVVTGCYIDGLSMQGLNNNISHCTFHSNGSSGISTGTTGAGQGDGLTFEYNEVRNNNTRNLDGGNTSGGSKFLFVHSGAFRYNWIHDNNGFGLWFDTGNYDCFIEENVCELNHFAGLFYEASYGSVIRHNHVVDNGQAGAVGATAATYQNCVNVRISDSNCSLGSATRGSFTRNYIDFTLAQTANLGGLINLWDHSGTTARHVENWDINVNQFWLRGTNAQRVGGQDTGSGLTAFPVWTSGNSFFGNEYHVASNSVSYWIWDSSTGSGTVKTWAEWQAFHPGDTMRVLI